MKYESNLEFKEGKDYIYVDVLVHIKKNNKLQLLFMVERVHMYASARLMCSCGLVLSGKYVNVVLDG